MSSRELQKEKQGSLNGWRDARIAEDGCGSCGLAKQANSLKQILSAPDKAVGSSLC